MHAPFREHEVVIPVPRPILGPAERVKSRRSARANHLLGHLDKWEQDAAVPLSDLTAAQRQVIQALLRAVERAGDLAEAQQGDTEDQLVAARDGEG